MGATSCRRAVGHHGHGTGLTFAFDILTAIGLGAACGLRPFLPALVAGAFAAANATIDFDHSSYAFLEAPWWLLAVAAAFVATVLAAKLIPQYLLWVTSLVMGGLLGAGALED